MSRFGRMYAPFQAVFIWWVYHAYRLVETGDRRRWRWLLGLSAIGPLVWEGGKHGWMFDLDGNRVELYQEIPLPEDSQYR